MMYINRSWVMTRSYCSPGLPTTPNFHLCADPHTSPQRIDTTQLSAAAATRIALRPPMRCQIPNSKQLWPCAWALGRRMFCT